ncbi:MAG: plastocyanin/azurin family copper-binding protein [Chitinophagales bacterium]|nr:plastocyanin/azurin family copper-binding protein [Chitinophagales bacterium]
MNRLHFLLTPMFLVCALMLTAQTNHSVDVQSNFYNPEMLTIAEGDTVTWTNLGGFHNVNGSQATYPNNPEGFINGSASGASWTYSFVFNTPGTYEYQCDPHVSLGMTGTIVVDPAASGATDLLLTGVYDGPLPGGQPKGIELYVLNDIADLSIYGVGSANNGGGTDGEEFTFPAQAVTAGTYLYLTADEVQFNAFFGFDADFIDEGNSSSMGINGDDAIELFMNGEVVDVFGDIDQDGTGTAWEYLDGWAYRVDGTGPDGSTFVLSNWNFSGINVFDGESENATAAVPFPIGTYNPGGSGALTANNDLATTDVNQAVNINVLANDFLPNVVTSLTAENGANGTTSVSAENIVTYTPAMDFCGEDSFTYEVCDADGCQTATVTVTVNCPVSYPEYTIGQINTVDADGAADSVGTVCQLSGIVYGVNLRSGGLQFTIIDSDVEGIGVFSGNNNYGYTVQEGDEVIVQGEVTQFSGLTQIDIDTVWMVSAGNALVTPTIITGLGEDTESQLVKIEDVSLVDPAQWTGSGSGFNVEVTNGVDVITVRIDNDVDLYSLPAPTGTFDVTGIGGQFDNSSPFDEGYQLLPRYMEDIDPYEIPTTSYPAYTVGEVTTVDADGVIDSLDISCQLQGIVYGVNLSGNGLQFTINDAAGDGIAVFSSGNDFGYTVTEGDEVALQGTITQFAGLAQINLDTMWMMSAGNMLSDPLVVTDLNEDTESQLVRIEGLTLLDPGQWNMGSSFNVQMTDGTNEYTMRIDADTDVSATAGPGNATFTVTGIGGQFDTEAPFDGGYQILPRYTADIDILDATVDRGLESTINIFPNPADQQLNIRTTETFDAIRMINSLGQEVLFITKPTLNESINLGGFAAGAYRLTFVKENRIWTESLIVK